MTGYRLTRMTRLAIFVVPVLAALLALPGTTYAQRMTADLTGTVVDESGGVIPGADVLLINQASRSERRSVTNTDGFFNFAAVPSGTYTVQVSLAGFQTFEVTGISLGAGDSRTLRNLPLKVATVAETVSVTAEVQLTPLNSGERSTTLTAETIENIPIVGSSAAELLRILPGMTPISGTNNQANFNGEIIGINGNGEGGQQSAIGNYSANGNQTKSLDITVDGAPGADPGCNCATSVNPNSEFIQEFKVLQSSFSAEYSKGPNSMTVVSKSGGRDFHGSAFLYFRDYHLNSNEWLTNKVGKERTKNKFVYPGFTFSGPLSFGGFNKNRDKVFFFVGYEYYKQTIDTGNIQSWVPTNAMRNGDFSELATAGWSGNNVKNLPNGYPGGIIPQNQIDPGGKVLLNLFPQPNADPAVTGGYNYFDNLLVDQPNHQFLTRLDFNISDNTKMFVRYNMQRETQNFVVGLWWRNGAPANVPALTPITAPNRSDSITTSLTHVFDPTLTSETILAMTYIDFPNQYEDRSKMSRSGYGYPYNGVLGENQDIIPAMLTWGNQAPSLWSPGGLDPILFATKWQYAITQNFTKVWGTHTAKAGVFWERITNAQPGDAFSHGAIINETWGSNSTGNTFADLLMGRVTQYQESQKNTVRDIAWNRWEAFLQDSWKVKPNVTLNLGLRGSVFEPWTDRGGNGVVVFDEARYASDVAAGVQFPGVTWNARDSSVPMQGVGTSFYIQPRLGFAWDIRGTGETVLRGGAGLYLWHDAQQPYNTLVVTSAGVKEYSTCCGTTLTDLEKLAGSSSLTFNSSSIDINDDKQPNTWTWSLTVNQKLPWSMNLELGYVGNSQLDQIAFNGSNANAIPLGSMLGNPGGDQGQYRPFPSYGSTLNVYQHSLDAQYHGLQALLARQRGNFNYTLAYTFSKVLGFNAIEGAGPGLSQYNHTPYRNYNYGVLQYDRTHVASASFSWLLPEPQSEGVAKAILGGWQMAGILNYVSGSPLLGNFGLTGTGVGGVNLGSNEITGSPDSRANPILTCNPAENVPSGYFINPACFSAPSPGNNGAYNVPYMKSNDFWNVDLSLFKNFSIGGDKKLQLRMSGYNVFNHPTAYPDNSQNLTLRYDQGVMTSTNFGKLGDDFKFGRRIIQFAIRFTF